MINGCCNKDMIKLNSFSCDRTKDNEIIWVCGVCGSCHIEYDLNMDDEDFNDFIDNFRDELKGTEILKDFEQREKGDNIKC